MRNNTQKGNLGLAKAIEYFVSNGYIVSIPLNDTQDYDLIVDKDGFVYKVQVKYTSKIRKNGNFIVKVCTYGGNRGGVRYTIVKNSHADLLFVLQSDEKKYLIPVSKIRTIAELTLNQEFEEYKID